jgi:integrase
VSADVSALILKEETMKPTTGYVYRDKSRKRWVARVSYTDEATGKRQSVRRWYALKSDAVDALPDLIATLKTHGARPLKGEILTIADVIDAYEKEHVKAPEIHHGRKVAGLKSWISVKHHCEVLREHFGKKLLRELRPSHLQAYKQHRLKMPTVRGQRQRTIASVNRELETLRAALNHAKREGWLITSPFEKARAVIAKSSEARRFRVLSREEETKLLEACYTRSKGKRQCWTHLRPIIIAALDTGARRGELFKLKWADVDFAKREIKLLVSNTKTEQERLVPITSRLLVELERLQDKSGNDPNARVFPYGDIKHAFASVCKEAGVNGFRLHDCRHTTVSRLVAQGVALGEVMRISGHSTMEAFNRYLNLLSDATKRSADALNAYHEQNAVQPASGLVN